MSAINTLGVIRSADNLLTLFDADVSEADELSQAYERHGYRHHVAQLSGDDAGCSVDVEASLDGTNWTVVATITGVNVLQQIPNSIFPCLRAKRNDTTEAPLTFKILSYAQ